MSEDFRPESVSWVLDQMSLKHLLEAIETCDEVVLDLETTGLDEHAVRGGQTNGGYPARVSLASLTLPQPDDVNPVLPTTWVVPLSHPDSPFLGRWRETLRAIAQAILEAGHYLTNQNLKFDVRWIFAMTGVDLSSLIAWDTQGSFHLLDENIPSRLGVRVPMEFGIDTWKDFDFSKPGEAERVPLMDLGMYGARDTYWVWRAANHHRRLMNLVDPEEPQTPDEVERARLGRLSTYVVMPTVATLTAIEQRGMVLDVEWTQQQLEEHVCEADKLKEELATRYYSESDLSAISFAPTSNWFKAWAEMAVEKGDLKVAAMTDKGNPQWNKGVLLRQARAGSEVAEQLLEYRGHVKKAEYLASWLHFVTPQGTVHSSYNAGRVATGRLSSDSPNQQQVTSTLRPGFIPRPGHYFAELDQSQVEMRTAAFISRCKPMMEAFRRGDDLHKMLAAAITGKEIEDVTSTERQGGKVGNFGLLFSMGPLGFQQYAETSYGLAFTIEEAEKVHSAFYTMWDGVAQWHAKAIRRAKETGQVVSPIGRVRRLPHIWDSSPRLSSMAERQAINSPVQGFASDILMIGASSIEGTLPQGPGPVEDVRLVGTVHDSLLIEVPIDGWESLVRECLDRMTSGVLPVLEKLDCHFDIPLVVEAKIGTRWGLSDVGVMSSA